jgi:hypothetical protein
MKKISRLNTMSVKRDEVERLLDVLDGIANTHGDQ